MAYLLRQRTITIFLIGSFLLFSPSHGMAAEKEKVVGRGRRLCRKLIVGATLASAALGGLWLSFDTTPPAPVKLFAAEEADPAPVEKGMIRQIHWQGERHISTSLKDNSGQPLRIRLLDKTPMQRSLSDVVRQRLATDMPNVEVHPGPGIVVSIDQVKLSLSNHGEIYLSIITPFGELRSETPLPEDRFYAGKPVTFKFAPLALSGEAGSNATIEAVARIRLHEMNPIVEIEEAVIRLLVKVPNYFINQQDDVRILRATADFIGGIRHP